MSLIRQVWLLLLATLMLALLASITVNVGSAREMLQTQLRLKNSDNATTLALVLSQQKGQRELMELAAAAQFDTGYYQRIRFVGADGSQVFQREAQAQPGQAPSWFVALVPIESVPGSAQVSDGWRALGAIEVVSQVAFAHDELWQGSVRAALALTVVGILAALLAALAVGRIRRPLDQTVAQAASLQRGEYVTVAEPNVPELRRLARAMNAMVARLRVVFEGQASQVESLRRQAGCDASTGLFTRGQFMARLNGALHRDDGTRAGGIVLLRILQLAEINRQLGRDATDSLIGTVAHTLQAYSDRVEGAFVGRLNGADFALVLPEGGVAHETALSVVGVLRAALAGLAARVAVAAGAVEMRHGAEVAELMCSADLALASAESDGPFSVAAGGAEASGWAGLGEHVWHERVADALTHGRVRLASFPVVDAQGRLIHLECPLRMQLVEGGDFEVAAHWLPLALRCRLTAAVDEQALALVLSAIEKDGRARCVNLSPASLSDSGFSARLRGILQASPHAARKVWIEIGEIAAAEQFELLSELARQVRSTGAKFGLEHAGERIGRIERLFEAGLDYVKLDTSVTSGVADDASRARFVDGLTTLLHGMSVQVIAEGVGNEADALALRASGVDGLTGPWVGA